MTKVIDSETDSKKEEIETADIDRQATDSAAASDDHPHEATHEKKPFLKRPPLIALLAVALIVGLVFGVRYYLHAISHESTDDAFIEGHIIQISPKVSGTVVKLHVTDNQHVKKGDLLVEIDPRDYEARLAQARANLQAAIARHKSSQISVKVTSMTSSASVVQASSGVDQARANVEGSKAQVQTARSQLAQAGAQVKAAQADLEQACAEIAAAEADAAKAGRDAVRYEQLYKLDEVSRQQFDSAAAAARVANANLEAARSQARAAEAQVAAAQAAEQAAADSLRQAESAVSESEARVGQARGQLDAARAAPQQVAESRSQVDVASAEIEQAQAAVRQAELELSYTKIYAPEDGRVTERTVEQGGLVQVGQPLFAIVPDNLWVVANFKETQLTYMRPGQPVKVSVDAYPGKGFNGHVDSIQRGSGAAFSLLPPENATGNYVKVVQPPPGRSTAHCASFFLSRPYFALIISSAKSRSRTCSIFDLPTRCLSRSGIAIMLKAFRSRWPRASACKGAGASTKRWARFATWCRTICCR